MVPTFANSPSWRGTSRTRSSSPTRTGSVTSMVGKTTVSSSGTSRSDDMACGFTFCSNLPWVGGYRVPAAQGRHKKISVALTQIYRVVVVDDRSAPLLRRIQRPVGERGEHLRV